MPEVTQAKHYPLPDPDPNEFLVHVTLARQLTQKRGWSRTLAHAHVTDVVNRVDPLTLAMIRRLVDGLQFPADVLITLYELLAA